MTDIIQSPDMSFCKHETILDICCERCDVYVTVLMFTLFCRPHRNTTYVDAAYCYRRSSLVCRYVCLSVSHDSEP